MIEELLPPWASAEEAYDDPPGDPLACLFPEEAAAVARAVPKRQREFAGARRCARAALARLGAAPVPLVPGPRGAPPWPAGVVGSMTHCAGYRAAAVALGEDAAALGIDAEPDGPLPDGVLEVVALPAEQRALAALAAAHPGVCWDRLLFSAKESVFKTWYPLTHRELDFSEAELAIDPAGAFTATLLVPGPVVGGERVGVLAGRWLARGGLLVTGIALPSGPRHAYAPRHRPRSGTRAEAPTGAPLATAGQETTPRKQPPAANSPQAPLG